MRSRLWLPGIAIAGMMLAPTAWAAWTTQTVDGTGGSGFFNSVAVNPVTGFPAIAYSAPSAHNQDAVKLAEWNGASWDVSVVASGKAGDVQVCLAFDSAGNPSVVYTISGVKFAHRTGSSWFSQTLDSKGGGTASLAYQAGQPWVAFATSTALKIAHQTGSSWIVETVDGSGMSYMSLAFAPDGNPSVAYRSGTGTSVLKFAHKSGSSWAVQSVAMGTYYGVFTSLAYDPLSGNPTIAHSNGTDVRFHRFDGSTWVLESAATGTCTHTSLAYDAAGVAAISYDLAVDGSGYHQLHIARRNGCLGGCWTDELVDDETPLYVQWRTSLTFDATGAATIGYGVAYPQIVKLAEQTP